MTKHSKTLLAKSKQGEMSRCTCGAIHLAFGPISMRISEHDLGELAGLFGEVSSVAGPRARSIHVPPNVSIH